MKDGTTKQLVAYFEEAGTEAMNKWYEDKVAMLEEMLEIGFEEAAPALKAIKNSYDWVHHITSHN